MGELRNGESAGALAIIDAATGSDWSTLFTPTGLCYDTSSNDIDVYRVSGVIRQIHAPAVSVDVQTISSNQYRLDFYNSKDVAGGSNPRSFTGNPYVTYTIEQVGSTTELKITKKTYLAPGFSSLARTEYTTLERSGSFPAFTWSRHEWTTDIGSPITKEQRVWGGTASDRTEQAQVGDATLTTVVDENHRTYHAYDWGEEIVGQKAGNSTDALDQTEYGYYDTSSVPGSYAMIKSIVHKDVQTTPSILGWTAYEYETANTNRTNLGNVSRMHRPFLDFPASVPSSLSTDDYGEVTTYTYSADAFGLMNRPATIVTAVKTATASTPTTTARTEFTYSNTTANGMSVVEADRDDWVDTTTSHALLTVTKYYREDVSDSFFRSQIHSIAQPDGRKISYARQKGDWNPSTKAITIPGTYHTASRICMIEGMKATASGLTTCTSLDGYTVDTIYLVTNKSTLRAQIRDDHARLVREELKVWNGSAWQLVSATDYGYTDANQLATRTDSNGASSTTNYEGELISSTVDTTGIETDYDYDQDGRLTTVTQKEVDDVLPNDVVATDTLDALGRIVQRAKAPSGGGETITTSKTYNTAGRLVDETPSCQCLTTYSYAYVYDGSRYVDTRTTTFAEGGTRVDTFHFDGRKASVTGSSVVGQYYEYEVQTSGDLLTRIRKGGASSSRYTEIVADLIGRTVSTTTPTFSGVSPSTFVVSNLYDTTTGRLTETTRTNLAPIVYGYDELGRLYRTALDLDNNGLVLASGDRIDENESYYENDSGAWWFVQRKRGYFTPNDATPKVVSLSRIRLTGFATNRLSEVQMTDIDGNTLTTTVDVNASAKTVTKTTTSSAVTNTQVETRVAGLLTSAVAFNGGETTYHYDELRRLMSSIDGTGIYTKTDYKTGSYRVGSTMTVEVPDPGPTGPTTTYDYDGQGRTTKITDPTGKITYYGYNARDQVVHQWGTGAYPIEYGYDPNYGDLTTMTTYRGGTNWGNSTWPTSGLGTADTTTWTYDTPSGLLASKTDADSKTVSYAYNARGQVLTRTTPISASTNTVTTYSYEDTSPYQTGELSQISYSGSGAQPTTAVVYRHKVGSNPYDRVGRVLEIDDATGTRSLTYRSSDLQLDVETLPGSFFGSSSGHWPTPIQARPERWDGAPDMNWVMPTPPTCRSITATRRTPVDSAPSPRPARWEPTLPPLRRSPMVMCPIRIWSRP